MPTKKDLEEEIANKDRIILELKQEIARAQNGYIMVEAGERNFTIGKRIVGTKDKYSFIATCRNRSQAGNLLDVLNGRKDSVLRPK